MSDKRYRPGQTAPRSGQYQNTTTRSEVTVTKGEAVPSDAGSRPALQAGRSDATQTDVARSV